MDAFKQAEISRMQNGGNKKWQDFYAKESGRDFVSVSIKERYDSEVGEEWKERLSAIVDGRDFDKDVFTKDRAAILAKQQSRSATPSGGAGKPSSVNSRTQSPAPGRGLPMQKEKNEAYFAKMGSANASRSDDLPPSQGGKYAGFGSAVPEPTGSQENGIPSAADFQNDPMAALTRGFGWFSTTVAKQAKTVNDSYIQPTAKNVCPMNSSS